MDRPVTSRPGKRPPLTRDRVVEAAVHLADVHGIHAMSMRRLANELGVEAMSLYHHVGSKDELLSEMLDTVVGEMALPQPDEHWKTTLRAAARSAHEVLVRHPWAANLLLDGPRVSMARLRQMNAILGSLRRGGFSPAMTDHAYHALDSHIMGFTLWEVGISAGMQRLPSVAGFLDRLDVEALPHLGEHIEQHLRDRDPDEPGEFDFGLDLVLDGLERYLAGEAEEGQAGA